MDKGTTDVKAGCRAAVLIFLIATSACVLGQGISSVDNLGNEPTDVASEALGASAHDVTAFIRCE